MNTNRTLASFILHKALACYFLSAVFVFGIMLVFFFENQKNIQAEQAKIYGKFVAEKLQDVSTASLGDLVAHMGTLDAIALNDEFNVGIATKSTDTLWFKTEVSSADTPRRQWSTSVSNVQLGIISVTTSAPLQPIYDALLYKAQSYLVLLVVQLLFLWALFKFLVVRFIRRAIQLLSRDLEILNLKNPTPLAGDPILSGFSEYRRILVDINRVITSLVVSRNQVERMNEQLEEKVREKTLSLEEKNNTLVQLNQHLSTLANTDSLTQVYNRTRFDLLFRENVAVSQRRKTNLSLLLIDLDDFKNVNDQYGHQVGDQVLKHVAQSLSETLGDHGILARWGGEEFAVLLPYYDEQRARGMGEILRQSIDTAYFEDQQIHITLSVGVARLGDDETGNQLLNRADMALYEAKESGRNRVIVAKSVEQKQLTFEALSNPK
ncbi:GGDEF domain-containing protein [Marinomonas mediterranea]|uniref:diguanylate cyclase n=1 Tax=Marinomonas mediterranea (strain ATCC 700492 / JCM 21426 / NBRC 103028 / MMB-1) TaxID=717774 RepID=F2JUQ1_MARM1|nr:GGDEF domain-containing protein [Marinomonas mediterranea]ADZ90466.1 diguanylate cyclase [Marinomonas mediterranea MMB-1]WCN08521.1 diguanylate cyclase [Marinomonas mediterranea]WCN12575.1 diguanylate cyclase [Marinomonas mediterranea]WCN16646.1 diguanylate cyclase [Marinomonas mediterranea MMB-1]